MKKPFPKDVNFQAFAKDFGQHYFLNGEEIILSRNGDAKIRSISVILDVQKINMAVLTPELKKNKNRTIDVIETIGRQNFVDLSKCRELD